MPNVVEAPKVYPVGANMPLPIMETPHASDPDRRALRKINFRSVRNPIAVVTTGALAALAINGAIGGVKAQTPEDGVDPNCPPPSPSLSLEPSTSPGIGSLVENPDGSFDLFVSPSPLTSDAPASPLADADPAIAQAGDGTVAQPDESQNPETAVVVDPAIDPNCDPVTSPVPSASAEATPTGPAPDSIEALLKSRVDPKADIPDVINSINNMYKKKEYKAALARLHSFYSENTPINKKIIIDFLKKCRDERLPSTRNVMCLGNIINFITYAQQYPLDSGDPIDAEINASFVKGAQMLRSSRVNEGTPLKKLDRDIASDAMQLDLQ